MTRQVQVRSGASHPVNPKAYEAYLRGLAYSKQPCDECEGISLEYFNRAIQIDPKWAPAYAQLARSYHYMASGLVVLSQIESRRPEGPGVGRRFVRTAHVDGIHSAQLRLGLV